MKKKFIKSQFKSLLLPGLVLGGILVVAAFFIGALVNAYCEWHLQYDAYGNLTSRYVMIEAYSGMTALMIFAVTIAFLMPFFVFSYRFSLKKADIYFQAPYEERTVRNTRVLVGLFYVGVAFTIAFLLLVSVYGLRVIATQQVATNTNQIVRAQMDAAYYFLGYILGLFTVLATYLITSFFSSTCTSLPNAVITAIEGLTILALGFLCIIYWKIDYDQTYRSIYSSATENLSYVGFSPVHSILYFAYFIENPAVGVVIQRVDDVIKGIYLFDTIGYVVIGGLLTVPLMLMKEPSGETAGKGFGASKLARIIHHTFFGFCCFASYIFVIGAQFLIFAIGYTITGVVYWLITAWENRTFKFKQKDFIPMICSYATCTITSMVYFWMQYQITGYVYY